MSSNQQPFSNDEDNFDNIEAEAHPDCVEWVQERLFSALHVDKQKVFQPEHRAVLTEFLVGDEKKLALFCYLVSTKPIVTSTVNDQADDDMDAAVSAMTKAKPTLDNDDVDLKLMIGHPNLKGRAVHPGMQSDIAYFVRMDPKKDVTPENIDNLVSYGLSKSGQVMDTFLRTMQHVVAPSLLRNKSWPDSIQKDFNAVMHKFMALLTENANRLKGNTVLYVPMENLGEDDLRVAHHNKELVQRFESAIMHWTRQIKEVLAEKDVDESGADSAGPLDEIEYWRVRTRDLNNIRKQLNRKDVLQIVDVLTHAKSYYFLEPFSNLRADIENGTTEAIDNLRYLNTLVDPCKKLASADPKDIPGMVKPILRTVQCVFLYSKHYKKERFFRLLRMIGNEIVNRCRKKINLQAIFDGRVEESMVALQESIEAGKAWVSACKKMLYATAKHYRGENSEQLDMEDKDSIWNEINGFIEQRCVNLQEVCRGQLQFGFRVLSDEEADEGPPPGLSEKERDEWTSARFRGMLPCFGGSKGTEIESQLLDIQRNFRTKMEILRKLNYDILDVKQTRWNDDFRVLKAELDNLTIMMTQIISSAFELVATVESGAENLEAFHYLAKKEELAGEVDKRKDGVFRLLGNELKAVQDEFGVTNTGIVPPVMYMHPPKAGLAYWSGNMRSRILSAYTTISRCYYLRKSKTEVELLDRCEHEGKRLDEYGKRHYREWKDSLPQSPAQYLDTFLIARRESDTEIPLFTVNFPMDLLMLFEEARAWQVLGEQVPANIQDICMKEERLRVFRENIGAAVRAYNTIVLALNTEERRLFAVRITTLENKYQQGLDKLYWSTPGMVDFFVRECRSSADKLQFIVKEFKHGVELIRHNCKVLAETLAVSIEKKHTYEVDEFEDRQRTHRAAVRDRIITIHDNIVKQMKKLFDFFRTDYVADQHIRVEWHRFVETIDKLLVESLKEMVKRSVQEIEHALPHHKDEEKADEQVFQLHVTYEFVNPNDTAPQIATKPTVNELKRRVTSIGNSVIDITKAIVCLEEALGKIVTDETDAELEEKKISRVNYENPNPDPLRDYYSEMLDPNESLKSLDRIGTAFSSIESKVKDKLEQTLQLHSQGSKHEQDLWAPGSARRHKEQAPTLDLLGYQGHIKKFTELKESVEKQDTKSDILFLMLDFTSMKDTMRKQCQMWLKSYFGWLHDNVKGSIDNFYGMFANNYAMLMRDPKSLTDLSDQMTLSAKVSNEVPHIEAQFEPLFAKFNYLVAESRHASLVSEEDVKRKDELPIEFEKYKDNLEEGRKKLEKAKETFKADLETELRAFATGCENLKKNLAENGPYGSELQPTEAFSMIAGYKRNLNDKRQQESDLSQGMELFSIPRFQQTDLQDLAAELQVLENMWNLCESWRREANGWKNQYFKSLSSNEMENQVEVYRKSINKIKKDLGSREVWKHTVKEVDLFRRVLPVIEDLLDPAIDERHWDQLKFHLEARFDTKSDEFCLESLLDLHVEKQSEFVATLATAARQERKIEVDLEKMETVWLDMTVTIEPYHAYNKITAVDDINNTLTEHITMLSSMKMSRFVEAFRARVQHLEQTLSIITDTVEALLLVQTKWMYLENIFIGSADIKRKLVEESKLFEHIHGEWIKLMTRLSGDPNIKRNATSNGRRQLEDLNEMSQGLEKIQKSLESFLDDRRRDFPRFYFLSNDDLLEILGHTKEPEKVQPHLRKCFEGLFKLDLKTVRQKVVADAMFSADGERVPFTPAVQIEGLPVEVWLRRVEEKMRDTVQTRLNRTLDELTTKVYHRKKRIRKEDLAKWIETNEGQCTITASSINWTMEAERCIEEFGEIMVPGIRRKASPVYKLYKKWKSLIKKYCWLVRQPQDRFQRNKLVALITIEVHCRDILRTLQLGRVHGVREFDWAKQLRFYRATEKNDRGDENHICVIRQTSEESCVKYDYEYLGNSGRLVVTGLTDRAYMTLTTALKLNRGGLPQGPAGTGKTETVKDLGKAIAKYVMVFNCSDGLDFKSLGRMFSGLAQTGGWSCFDEFNRIEVEVLSVVAQQILCILNAVKEKKNNFIFEGNDIPLNRNCGIFVTMNPGYAGRSELPDNLKALLRPISMMTPDFALICEITLLSEGFEQSSSLSKKVAILYELMEKQLSKQDHYDFSLRNIKAVLVQAGNLKRENFPGTEYQLCLKAMMDMNLPKFVKDDVPLFLSMLGDLFPRVKPEDAGLGDLMAQTKVDLTERNLEINEHICVKVLHLWDTLRTRHGVMVVGQTGSGKTVTWQSLAGALKRCKDLGLGAPYEAVRVSLLNPKSVTMDELYGSYNKATREWKDGILSEIMRTICRDESLVYKWLLFDGPVDTLWIESMNTVLDDNKMLTLNSGERISLTPQISMLFEVQDLSQASPATVSRCGMVFFNVEDLSWSPFVTTWLKSRKNFEIAINGPKPEVTHDELLDFINTNMARVLDFKKRECVELFPRTDISIVRSFTTMFDALANPEAAPACPGGVPFPTNTAGENYIPHIRMVATFCLLWSAGGALTEESRRKFDVLIREIDSSFPSAETSFEYFVDFKTHNWKSWDEHPELQHPFAPPEDTPYYKLIVPTVDTVRYHYIVKQLVRSRVHTVLIGNTGTGKSLVAAQVVKSFSQETHVTTQLNFSAQTSSRNVQDIIEGKMEHQSKKVCSPPGGRRMICLIEDLNMPAKEKFGAQPPLELLRQWMDNGNWYDRETRQRRIVNEMQLLCCMTFGRPDITQRMLSKLNMLNITFPSETILTKIFTAILSHRFHKFPTFLGMTDLIVRTTIQVYTKVTTDLLPIPSKSHYLYNLRDLSKVFQGLYGCYLESFDESREHLILLWIHESFRVFADRMNDPVDKSWFKALIIEKLAGPFQTKWSTLLKARNKQNHSNILPAPPPTEKENPIFVDFWDGEFDELAKYKIVPSMPALKKKMEDTLDSYNGEPGARTMNLVFFTDALEHLCRIHRIIRQPRGNALLVGLGGSGRNSMTRLAAYLAGYKVFSIEIHKKYDVERFHDDLRNLYRTCGGKDTARVFYFSDNQIMDSTFLEDLNNMLSVGEVPNLFPKDDVQQIAEEVRRDAKEAGMDKTTDDIFSFFIERARRNLHLVVAMSPAHKLFRIRLRQFPALVSCTSIDWFVEWPNEALMEVAMKFLSEMEGMGDPERQEAISAMFVLMHDSTNNESRRMKETLKRFNYVTPSSYLDLVRGYQRMLTEKTEELCLQRDKLSNGMSKLEQTKHDVDKMSVELRDKEEKLNEKTILVDSETQKAQTSREKADAQQSQLTMEKARIERDKQTALAISAEAEADLEAAMPALLEAEAALDSIKKSEIDEIKSYNIPNPAVLYVLKGVQTALLRKTEWADCRASMADSTNFVQTLKTYPKNNMSDSLLSKLEKFTKDKEKFQPDKVRNSSSAAAGLCTWVIAIHNYGMKYKEVRPKIESNEKAKERVRVAEEKLRQKEEGLREVLARVKQYEERVKALQDEKDELLRNKKETEEKLKRAKIIVSGLEGERDRWTQSIERYNILIGNLPGDALLASGFLSYTGAFPAEFRHALLTMWGKEVRRLQIPMTKTFDFVNFLVDPTEVRDWQAVGLPGDDFSTENAVVVTRGSRWPLMIDPQQQAKKWIKNMERNNGLKEIDQKQPDFMKVIEHAVQFGTPVLLVDILEEIDPALDSVVSKAIVKKGARAMIKIGDNFIEYNENFKLYITTRMSNPHYTPETCTKVCLLNFAVKEQGLEEQLLKIVVVEEKPDLEKENDELIQKTADAKKRTKELEDEILTLLSANQGSLLENHQLIETLQTSKITAANIQQQLKEAEATREKISSAREQYRPCAKRAAILFFVLADLGAIDTMYQFALDSYIILFQHSISKSREKHPHITTMEDRIQTLNDWHTDSVYRNTCRGLFEKHKLLFSFHMTMKILMGRGDVNVEEYVFFMKGGQILDTTGRLPNPAPQWLTEKSWDNILEMDKLLNFHGIAASFEQNPQDWKLWFLEEKPEEALLPGEWQAKTAEHYLQRMVLVRSLRSDRVVFMVHRFIEDSLDARFVDPPAFNLNDTYQESKCIIPLVFVLSPGVDPTNQLQGLATRNERTLRTLALGQGQGPNAVRLISESTQNGGWVFLANCHLMISWLVELEKIIENLSSMRPHDHFRLWLSSIPTPEFPIGILQSSIKMTTEPPTGIKANMVRLYNFMPDDQFVAHSGPKALIYRPLLFSLCFFHTVLLERKKFGTLGYNVIYDFNQSDFEVSENIISSGIENMPDDNVANIPFTTLRYLIAEASYGGRVTDDWDRRVINTYMEQFMCAGTVSETGFKLSAAEEYYIPEPLLPLELFLKHCKEQLPITDPPEAFGQHGNADIASQISNSHTLLDNLIDVNATLARGGAAASGGAKVQSVEERCMEILSSLDEPSKACTPQLIDYDAIYEATNEDRGSALNTCLLQELQRYNILLKKINRQKAELRSAVKGEIVMNDELDSIFNALLVGKVPLPWTTAYPSSKPLASWALDLVDRVDQMKLWGQRAPKVFWLAGFTYPTGFLKSLQQQQARRDQISIDEYGWEFQVLPSDAGTIMHAPKEGAYMRGVYLEGAGWNSENGDLCEPNAMELVVSMPLIHFIPKRREGKVNTKNVYQCPLYMYPVRTGTRERPSFVVAVDLPSKTASAEHWTKRGTALLLSTDE